MRSLPAGGVPTRVLIVCNLSRQREDLEFSVGSKATVWEVKAPLLAGGADYGDEDSASNYTHGGPPASLVGGVSGKQLYQNGAGGGPGRGYPPPMERF